MFGIAWVFDVTPTAFANRPASGADREQALLMNEGSLGAGAIPAVICLPTLTRSF
jgi:hypothetical protein